MDAPAGLVIEARVDQLRNGAFSAEFSIEQHDADGVTETQFLHRKRLFKSRIRNRRCNSSGTTAD